MTCIVSNTPILCLMYKARTLLLLMWQDAAVLAAQEHPVPLGFAAEVGTNCYAKLSIPDFLDKVSWNVDEHVWCALIRLVPFLH